MGNDADSSKKVKKGDKTGEKFVPRSVDAQDPRFTVVTKGNKGGHFVSVGGIKGQTKKK